jgi:hypothetical protein
MHATKKYKVRLLLVTANVRSSPILVTLMMEALRSSETSVLQEPHGITFQKTPFRSKPADRILGGSRGGRSIQDKLCTCCDESPCGVQRDLHTKMLQVLWFVRSEPELSASLIQVTFMGDKPAPQ